MVIRYPSSSHLQSRRTSTGNEVHICIYIDWKKQVSKKNMMGFSVVKKNKKNKKKNKREKKRE